MKNRYGKTNISRTALAPEKPVKLRNMTPSIGCPKSRGRASSPHADVQQQGILGSKASSLPAAGSTKRLRTHYGACSLRKL